MDYVERRGIELGKEEVYAGIQGLPAAIKMYNTAQVEIREGTLARAFSFKIFSAGAPSYMTPATVKDRFKKLLKNGVCFTDGAGNVGWNQVTTASFIAHSMGDPVKKPGNKWPPLNLWRPIRVLQVGSVSHMERQAADYPYIIIEAKTSNRSFGGRGIAPFPQLDDYPVRVPMLCKDTVNWIPEIFVREIKQGEPLPELYYPPR